MASYTNILYKNGQGIPGVHVALYSLQNVKIDATTTEGLMGINEHIDSRYTFTDINPGQYELRFFGEGFDNRDWRTIDIAGDSIDIDKSALLERLIERASAITWSSRSIIDTMIDGTSIIRDINLTTLIISDGALRLPATTDIGTTYWYYTQEFETSITGHTITGFDQATCAADYTQGNGDIIIQTQFDSSNWYTWLDTSGGIDKLDTERTDLEFTDGTKLKLRIGITPGSDNTGGEVRHVAVYSGPDLFGPI